MYEFLNQKKITMFRCFISSFHFTYIPVERSPNWDNVALHDTSCLISMKISFQCCLTSMDVTFSVRNKCFLSFHHVAVSFSGSLWDCVTYTLGDWEQQHLVPYMERLVKILLWGNKEERQPDYGPNGNSRGKESAPAWNKEKGCSDDRRN